MERMFDRDSFLDEITNKAEAKSCVQYLAHNESQFRRELASEGLSYDEINDEVKAVWKNLLDSCKRVGYSDYITEAKRKQFNL